MKRYTAALLVVLVLLGACSKKNSGSDGATRPGSGVSSQSFNDTDVMFLQMMVPHHNQGLTIVRLAKNKPVRADVKQLAAAIEATQPAEAETMSGWLATWKQPSSAPEEAHAAHGGGNRLTSTEQIDKLAKTPDASFEAAFLNILIAHQDNAQQLARMEVSGGANPQAKELAKRIDESRSAQIKQMLGYIGQA